MSTTPYIEESPMSLSGFGAFGADDPAQVNAMLDAWAESGDGKGIKGIVATKGTLIGGGLLAVGALAAVLGKKGMGIPLVVAGVVAAGGSMVYRQSIIRQFTAG